MAEAAEVPCSRTTRAERTSPSLTLSNLAAAACVTADREISRSALLIAKSARWPCLSGDILSAIVARWVSVRCRRWRLRLTTKSSSLESLSTSAVFKCSDGKRDCDLRRLRRVALKVIDVGLGAFESFGEAFALRLPLLDGPFPHI